MEQYREKLKLDIFIDTLLAAALLAVAVLAALGQNGVIPLPAPANPHWASRWRGVITGCCTGILGVLVFFIVRNIQALKSEAHFKKRYIQDNDERTIKIWSSAREAAYRTFLLVGLVAGLIAGFFSMTVCITIIACVFLASMIGLLYAIYYGIKI